MTNEEMTDIEATDDEKQQYHDALKEGFKRQHEDIITESMIKKIIEISPICELMIRSGLRVGEILHNRYDVYWGGKVIFCLNKKNPDYGRYVIHIIGNTQIWIKKLEALRKAIKGQDPKYIIDKLNRQLKDVIPKDYYKQSTHICRAIYVAYINRFKETKRTLPQIISEYLNHENLNASAYYNHIVLAPDVSDFLQTQELIIVRGVSGSGKTTFVKNVLLKQHPEYKHVEADMCYPNNRFDEKQTKNAHQKCERRVKRWLGLGYSVIVANSFPNLYASHAWMRIIKNSGLKLKIYRIDRDNPKPTHGNLEISKKQSRYFVKYDSENPYMRHYYKGDSVPYHDIVIDNNYLDVRKDAPASP